MQAHFDRRWRNVFPLIGFENIFYATGNRKKSIFVWFSAIPGFYKPIGSKNLCSQLRLFIITHHQCVMASEDFIITCKFYLNGWQWFSNRAEANFFLVGMRESTVFSHAINFPNGNAKLSVPFEQ